jgi:tRNA(Ile)-lysidine synthase TilS/MesJ
MDEKLALVNVENVNSGLNCAISDQEIWNDEVQLEELFDDTIEQYGLLNGINKIVFLFSGGKDATFGLYNLNRYLINSGLDIELCVPLVAYPLHVYFDEHHNEASCFTEVKEFWKAQGIKIDYFKPNLIDLNETSKDGCKTCKEARKSLIDPYLEGMQNKDEVAIATGYTLFDVLAYLDEFGLVSNLNYGMNKNNPKVSSRIQNCLHKMNIREVLPNGFKMIRPLMTFHETDILQYLLNKEIPYVNRPCKVSNNKHKRAYFKALETVAPINRTTYEGVMNFLESRNVDLPLTFDDIHYDNFFTDC